MVRCRSLSPLSLVALAVFAVLPGQYGASAKELAKSDLVAIQEKLKSNQYLTVDFTEDVYRSLRNRHTVSSGVAYFRKPSSFRWNLEKPKRLDWIFDGTDLFSLEGTSASVKKFGVGNAQGQELRRIVDMVMNLDTLFANYDLKKADDMGDSIFIEITPRSESDIRQANLTIDKAKNYISGIKLNFRGDNYTTFSFQNPKLSEIAPGVFQPPKGATIKSQL